VAKRKSCVGERHATIATSRLGVSLEMQVQVAWLRLREERILTVLFFLFCTVGCGMHVESALKGVPEKDRCKCPPEERRPGMGCSVQ